MLFSRFLVALALVSTPVLAKVSLQQKLDRVASLKKLTDLAPMLDISAYEREIVYEQRGLKLSQRAQLETDLLVSQIQQQVVRAYEAALKESADEGQAVSAIREAIKNDLELADVSLRDELLQISESALSVAREGKLTSASTNAPKLHKILLKASKEKADFLNQEDCCEEKVRGGDPVYPTVNTSKDSEKKEYKNKQELIESLVSDRESTRWVSSSSQTIRTEIIRRREGNISLQVKIEFLGVSLTAGPQISFTREFSTNAYILGEGMAPSLLPDGNFDFYKRDRNGSIVMKAGKPQKRFMAFYCATDLHFETEYKGEGGFKFMGMGGGAAISNEYSNTVDLSSRRVALPEYLAGQTVTMKYLSELCHNDFLNARFNNTMTVRQSLETMMKNLVAALRFSHPKTKCAVDEHCYDWYNTKVLALSRIKNFPRCVEERREKFRACELRGLPGQNCALFNKQGERITDGMFEFACDVGTKCVQVQEGGWFTNWELYQYPKGQCKPIAKGYRDPIQLQKERDDRYIEINLNY